MTVVRYELTASEFAHGFFKIRRWTNPQELISLAINCALVTLLLVISYSSYHGWGGTPKMWFVGGMAAVTVAGVVYVGRRSLLRRSIARHVREQPQLHTPVLGITFDADAVSFVTPTTTRICVWSEFKNRRQDKEFFYLYSGVKDFFAVVPKRAFDGEALAEFRRFSHLSPSA